MGFSGKEWPEDFEEDLRTTALPTADLAADLTTQVCWLFACISVWLSACLSKGNVDNSKLDALTEGKSEFTFKTRKYFLSHCTSSVLCEVYVQWQKVYYQVDIICGLLDIPRYRYPFQFLYLDIFGQEKL